MNARAYLRASTVEQDATRAREQVEAFAAERSLPIVVAPPPGCLPRCLPRSADRFIRVLLSD